MLLASVGESHESSPNSCSTSRAIALLIGNGFCGSFFNQISKRDSLLLLIFALLGLLICASVEVDRVRCSDI